MSDLSTISERQSLSKCQWLVFDAVGTLIDPDPPVAVAYHSVGSRFGTQFSVAEIGKRFRAAFRSSERDHFPGGPPADSRITSEAIEESRWRWIVSDVFPDIQQHEACFRELWEHFAQPQSWRCFADTGILTQLRSAGYRLAIASNFDNRLHSVCDALPPLGAIERRLISTSVGVRKPSSGFYQAIIEACGCQPSQILMVGDDPEHDVAAPRAAGLRALHLDRNAAKSTVDQLTSLEDLARRLR